jgi:hypothetical protein
VKIVTKKVHFSIMNNCGGMSNYERNADRVKGSGFSQSLFEAFAGEIRTRHYIHILKATRQCP